MVEARTKVQELIERPVTLPQPGHACHRAGPVARAVLTLFLALCGATGAVAQTPAVAHLGPAERVVRYAPNESGGRITITEPSGDSTSVELIRLELLETAASIRRGDFRKVTIVRTDVPAIKVLAAKSQRIRCTYRPTSKGGELVLLSDDDAVVKAIHQLLTAEPPGAA